MVRSQEEITAMKIRNDIEKGIISDNEISENFVYLTLQSIVELLEEKIVYDENVTLIFSMNNLPDKIKHKIGIFLSEIRGEI